jgi:hypothetical protein
MDHSSRLRARLLELRDDALDKMMRRGSVEPGQLPLLSDIAAALQVLSAGGMRGRAEVDDGGAAIVLRVDDGRVSASRAPARWFCGFSPQDNNAGTKAG